MQQPEIIYQEKNFAVVNKPAGLLVHAAPGGGGAEPTLADWLRKKFPAVHLVGDEPSLRPGIVHRLDKATSGAMLVPLNQEYFVYLKNLFKERRIKKKYLAWTCGSFKEEEGIIEKPIGLKDGSVKRSTHSSSKMLKPALTRYKVLETRSVGGAEHSLLEVMPATGRTHQIRVHLASIGHPVAGDVLYGGKTCRPEWAKRLELHAAALEFEAGPGRKISIEVPPPPDFGP